MQAVVRMFQAPFSHSIVPFSTIPCTYTLGEALLPKDMPCCALWILRQTHRPTGGHCSAIISPSPLHRNIFFCGPHGKPCMP
ncbi:hypothetical protein BCR44DRAFT_1437189 [Catenaria anguillulae PL171]|uniref:Uncharacterized protein n=1 Tax=Catenaria anguillulae PL171 TaxID=765915 RepID=A0A1Y2HH25_9FUNG|nr:hypothetical protein BCR44DRAFT_1437189 [Catenaria anguillulae PL171]